WLAKQGIRYTNLVIEESSRSRLQWKQDILPVQSRKYSETTLYFFAANTETL
ncbi:MAG: hypothetical protein JKY80_06835, partial [Mariprofundaceae bacterium]|nr:hypothetical protein [Mariprofundaceae bacterium]